MNVSIFSHAGEIHESTSEAASHALTWYEQIIIFIVVVFLVTKLLMFLTKKQDTTLMIVATLLLISGFGFFKLAPVISILSITLGLASTLIATLLGLSIDNKKSTK